MGLLTPVGLSPRLRGNRLPVDWARHEVPIDGSIPAPAGEPRRHKPVVGQPYHRAVYPRACGGTASLREPRFVPTPNGLSPRLRGNQRRRDVGTEKWRSIPAPAGEPSRFQRPPLGQKVYPRACGGTMRGRNRASSICQQGLSPRLRGNPPHFSQSCRLNLSGSIPAPAGEPHRINRQRVFTQVYPRACGGTSSGPIPPTHSSGLSPRLRGNPNTR